MNVFDLIGQFSRYVHRINDRDVSQMCGLAEGTNSATLKTANAIYYSIYNTHGLSKAATDNIAMTACAQQAVSTFCYYLVSLNVSGTVTVTKGTDDTYALPSTPAGNVPIGAVKVTCDASHTFTSGTTDFSATGITAAFYDIDCGMALTLINLAQTNLERGVRIKHNGRERTISDFDHMIVRDQATIASGASTVTLGFSGYKDFKDNGVTITDANSLVTQLTKEDVVPLGTTTTGRPIRISRLPSVETSFSPDAAPTFTFNIWPTADQDYTCDATAYQYSPELDCVVYSSNWLTENASDVLMFGALVEAGLYFPEDPRIASWREKWENAVWALHVAQHKEMYSGSYIGTNFPNPLAGDNGGCNRESYVLNFGY